MTLIDISSDVGIYYVLCWPGTKRLVCYLGFLYEENWSAGYFRKTVGMTLII